jgi:hypothetical protein
MLEKEGVGSALGSIIMVLVALEPILGIPPNRLRSVQLIVFCEDNEMIRR